MESGCLVTSQLAGDHGAMTDRSPDAAYSETAMPPEIESELRSAKRSSSLARGLLLPLAFTGGLASLGIEFAAARLLAPFFGQSLFIWGTLIGLILIYLTIGY